MNVDQIEKRLAGVERSLRRWRLGVGLLLLLVVGMGANEVNKGAPKLKGIVDFESVSAKRFFIYDDDGKQRGLIGIPPTDGAKTPVVGIESGDGQVTLFEPGNRSLRGIGKDGKPFGN